MRWFVCLLLCLASAPAGAQFIYPYQTQAQPVQGCPEVFDTRKTAPLITPEQFGAVGDGVTDDTAALQRALDSLTAGGTLQLATGKTYRKSNLLYMRKPNTRIWGYGATLFLYVPPGFVASNNNYRQAVRVEGQGSGVLGVRLTSNIGGRTGGNADNSAIHLIGDGVFAIDNLMQYTMGGIFARLASNFLVARNVIERSWADAMHATQGAHDGRFVCNLVREAGDDGIAVVNYVSPPGAPPDISDFEIAYNDIRNSQQGRGVAIIGGAHIRIHDNYIQQMCKNAGIIIAGDSNYGSASVDDVTVYNNTIKDIQLDPARWDPESKCTTKTGQAGIHLYTPSKAWRLDNVSVTNNVIERTYKYGLYAYNVNGCNVTESDNKIAGATIKPVVWKGFTCPDTPPDQQYGIRANRLLTALVVVLAGVILLMIAWFVFSRRKPRAPPAG
jgi:hypothetical protein